MLVSLSISNMAVSLAPSLKSFGMTFSRMAILIPSSTVSFLSVEMIADSSGLVVSFACSMLVVLMFVWAFGVLLGSFLVGLAPGGTLSIFLASLANLTRSSVLSFQRFSVMRSLILCASNSFGAWCGAGVGSLETSVSSERIWYRFAVVRPGLVTWALVALMTVVPGRS